MASLATVNTNDINKLMDKVFPLSVSVSTPTKVYEKGTTNSVVLTISTKRGDSTITPDSMTINNVKVTNFTSYTESVTATKTFTVTAISDSKSATNSLTGTYVNPSYSGVVSSSFVVNETNVKALTKAILNGKSRTITVSPSNQKVCIAYPKSFGAASSIKDANGFDYLASYTRSEITINSETYYVYLLTNATTISDMKQIIA